MVLVEGKGKRVIDIKEEKVGVSRGSVEGMSVYACVCV